MQTLLFPMILMVILFFVFLYIGTMIQLKQRKIKEAKIHTVGVVVKYSSNVSRSPIVRFEVNNKVYMSKLNYTLVTQISLPSKTIPSTSPNILSTHLKIYNNSVISINTLMKDTFPIGSYLNVYYNEANPKYNYVERYAKTYLGYIFFIACLILVFVVLLFYFLMKMN